MIFRNIAIRIWFERSLRLAQGRCQNNNFRLLLKLIKSQAVQRMWIWTNSYRQLRGKWVVLDSLLILTFVKQSPEQLSDSCYWYAYNVELTYQLIKYYYIFKSKAPCKWTQHCRPTINPQHCWMLHVASVWTLCSMLLHFVCVAGSCCTTFILKSVNFLSQQLPTLYTCVHYR